MLSMSGSETLESVKATDATDENNLQQGWFPSTHQLLPAQAKVAQEWIHERKQGLKSWREFVKTDKFHIPLGPAIAGRRIVRNIEYFQSNYVCVFAVLACYCILTSPLLIIALSACLGLLYIIKIKNADRPVRIGSYTVSPSLQYAGVAVLSFPLFYLAGAGSVIFWVIGASIFVIVLHAAFYASEEIPGADFEVETV